MRVGISWRRFGLLLTALALGTGLTATLAAGAEGPTVSKTHGVSVASTGSLGKDGARAVKLAPVNKDGMTTVVVKLDVAPVASYAGGVRGYAATRPTKGTLNLRSAAAQRYRSYVNSKLRSFATAATAAVPGAQVLYEYDVVLGGVAMLVPVEKIAALKSLPGVAWVERDTLVQADTEVSPEFIGATTAWTQGNCAPGGNGCGAGTIVGVIDTGLWPEHPSVDPNGGGGSYPNPPPPLTPATAPPGVLYQGRRCHYDPNPITGQPFTCNNKVIGGYRFLNAYIANVGLVAGEFSSARDNEGHGTHTTTTAAGNRGVPSQIFGIPRGLVSGIAPRAHVIMYKALGNQGGFSSDLAAAIQRAIQDNVDAINYSISGGNAPYNDAASLAFLDAYNAGVVPSTSAGNSGPGANTTGHNEPWTIGSAAATHNRHFLTDLKVGTPGQQITVTGTSVTRGVGPAPVVWAGSAPWNDPLCQNSGPSNRWAGMIVLCDRGVIGRVDKGFNVMRHGGIGMILRNIVLQEEVSDNHWIPTVHINPPFGNQVHALVVANPGNVFAQWDAGQARPVKGDVLAAFSSRGGPAQTLGITKPDVTAPGVQVLAGHTPRPNISASGPPGELFQSIAGTSMAAPHTTGGAALLAGLFPSWTPGQIKSALMTTSKIPVWKEDGVSPATPFDSGSGRIDLARAFNPGITFSAPGSAFCATGSSSTTCTSTARSQNDLWLANLPSVYIPNMPGIVSVPRTAHSHVGIQRTWLLNVETSARDLRVTVPSSIIVPAGGDTTFNITIDASAVPAGGVRFAHLTLTEVTDGRPRVNRIPISIVRGTANNAVTKTCNPTVLRRDEVTRCTISITNNTFDTANVNLVDNLPEQLRVIPGSVTGGGTSSADGRTVTWSGTVAAAQPENPQLGPGASPAGGYLPLSAFGITPIAGMGDETQVTFNTPPYTYAGNTYTQLGVISNGYLVAGPASTSDVSFAPPPTWPSPSRPNNTLAPLWTDLDPSQAGAVRIGVLQSGSPPNVDQWIVVDYNNVPDFSCVAPACPSPRRYNFEVWIGLNNDANPAEDISFAYGTMPATPGDPGSGGATGVENRFGNRGNRVYYDPDGPGPAAPTGTPPTAGTQLRVTSTPAQPGETKTIQFDAVAVLTGNWRNCAQVTSSTFTGTATSCVSGVVQ